jgi:hypothetical protein
MCDNCCFENGELTFQKFEISAVVGDLVYDVLGMKDALAVGKVKKDALAFGSFEKAVINMKRSSLPQTRAVLDLLLARREGGKAVYSLLSDLVKYFERSREGFVDGIPNGYIKFFIQHTKPEGTQAWYDFDHIPTALNQPSSPFIWPFLVLYECIRLGLIVEETFDNGPPELLSVACESLYRKANRILHLTLKRYDN